MSNVKSLPQPAQEDRKAGVTLTYADLNFRVLHQALEKLDDYTGFSLPDMSRFNKIKNAFDRETKQLQRLFQKLVQKHVVHEPVMRKDGENEVPVLKANGKPETKPMMHPTGRGTMDFVFRSKAAFDADHKILMATSFKVEAYQLLQEDLVKAGLTPKEIRACAKIISDIDPDLIDQPTTTEDEESDTEETASEGSNLNSDASNAETPTSDTPQPVDSSGGDIPAQ